MSNYCAYCNGLLGRDCFNQIECGQITNDMNYHSSPTDHDLVERDRERSVQLVMDLFYALREIRGTPTPKDLVKLARRIRYE